MTDVAGKSFANRFGALHLNESNKGKVQLLLKAHKPSKNNTQSVVVIHFTPSCSAPPTCGITKDPEFIIQFRTFN